MVPSCVKKFARVAVAETSEVYNCIIYGGNKETGNSFFNLVRERINSHFSKHAR